MVKDEPTLVAAYDDRDGVTAEFNLNMLHRLNRELDADFDPAQFRHRASGIPQHSRIEMHLESTCNQQVSIAAAQLDLYFEEGERIHTENSYKFTDMTIRQLLADAGFDIERMARHARLVFGHPCPRSVTTDMSRPSAVRVPYPWASKRSLRRFGRTRCASTAASCCHHSLIHRSDER